MSWDEIVSALSMLWARQKPELLQLLQPGLNKALRLALVGTVLMAVLLAALLAVRLVKKQKKGQSEQAAMENEAGTAQTQPAAQMGQVPAEARRLTVTQEGASAILQALCSAARTPTLRENLPDAPGQQAFYVTLRTGNAAQVVCLTPQAAFVQAKTENAVVYRIADGAGLYEAVRADCL